MCSWFHNHEKITEVGMPLLIHGESTVPSFFFFNDTATTEIYTLSLHDALPISSGGVSSIVIETCQDPLQIKAAVNGAKRAREAAGKDIPIIVRVTVETTGTLLVGADIAAAATIIHALDVPVIGLNCATGPREMAEHVKWLGDNWPGPISIQPNAGLPELIRGHTHYPLTPKEMAQWLERFVLEDGISMIGGCCGSEAEHIAALDQMLRRIGRD